MENKVLLLMFGAFFFLSGVAIAENGTNVSSAHQAEERIFKATWEKKKAWEFSLQEGDLLPELKSKVSQNLFGVIAKSFSQKTDTGAEFQFVPSAPKNDPSHPLGPAWESDDWLFYDGYRDAHGTLAKVTFEEGKRICEKSEDGSATNATIMTEEVVRELVKKLGKGTPHGYKFYEFLSDLREGSFWLAEHDTEENLAEFFDGKDGVVGEGDMNGVSRYLRCIYKRKHH